MNFPPCRIPSQEQHNPQQKKSSRHRHHNQQQSAAESAAPNGTHERRRRNRSASVTRRKRVVENATDDDDGDGDEKVRHGSKKANSPLRRTHEQKRGHKGVVAAAAAAADAVSLASTQTANEYVDSETEKGRNARHTPVATKQRLQTELRKHLSVPCTVSSSSSASSCKPSTSSTIRKEHVRGKTRSKSRPRKINDHRQKPSRSRSRSPAVSNRSSTAPRAKTPSAKRQATNHDRETHSLMTTLPSSTDNRAGVDAFFSVPSFLDILPESEPVAKVPVSTARTRPPPPSSELVPQRGHDEIAPMRAGVSRAPPRRFIPPAPAVEPLTSPFRASVYITLEALQSSVLRLQEDAAAQNEEVLHELKDISHSVRRMHTAEAAGRRSSSHSLSPEAAAPRYSIDKSASFLRQSPALRERVEPAKQPESIQRTSASPSVLFPYPRARSTDNNQHLKQQQQRSLSSLTAQNDDDDGQRYNVALKTYRHVKGANANPVASDESADPEARFPSKSTSSTQAERSASAALPPRHEAPAGARATPTAAVAVVFEPVVEGQLVKVVSKPQSNGSHVDDYVHWALHNKTKMTRFDVAYSFTLPSKTDHSALAGLHQGDAVSVSRKEEIVSFQTSVAPGEVQDFLQGTAHHFALPYSIRVYYNEEQEGDCNRGGDENADVSVTQTTTLSALSSTMHTNTVVSQAVEYVIPAAAPGEDGYTMNTQSSVERREAATDSPPRKRYVSPFSSSRETEESTRRIGRSFSPAPFQTRSSSSALISSRSSSVLRPPLEATTTATMTAMVQTPRSTPRRLMSPVREPRSRPLLPPFPATDRASTSTIDSLSKPQAAAPPALFQGAASGNQPPRTWATREAKRRWGARDAPTSSPSPSHSTTRRPLLSTSTTTTRSRDAAPPATGERGKKTDVTVAPQRGNSYLQLDERSLLEIAGRAASPVRHRALVTHVASRASTPVASYRSSTHHLHHHDARSPLSNALSPLSHRDPTAKAEWYVDPSFAPTSHALFEYNDDRRSPSHFFLFNISPGLQKNYNVSDGDDAVTTHSQRKLPECVLSADSDRQWTAMVEVQHVRWVNMAALHRMRLCTSAGITSCALQPGSLVGYLSAAAAADSLKAKDEGSTSGFLCSGAYASVVAALNVLAEEPRRVSTCFSETMPFDEEIGKLDVWTCLGGLWGVQTVDANIPCVPLNHLQVMERSSGGVLFPDAHEALPAEVAAQRDAVRNAILSIFALQLGNSEKSHTSEPLIALGCINGIASDMWGAILEKVYAKVCCAGYIGLTARAAAGPYCDQALDVLTCFTGCPIETSLITVDQTRNVVSTTPVASQPCDGSTLPTPTFDAIQQSLSRRSTYKGLPITLLHEPLHALNSSGAHVATPLHILGVVDCTDLSVAGAKAPRLALVRYSPVWDALSRGTTWCAAADEEFSTRFTLWRTGELADAYSSVEVHTRCVAFLRHNRIRGVDYGGDNHCFLKAPPPPPRRTGLSASTYKQNTHYSSSLSSLQREGTRFGQDAGAGVVQVMNTVAASTLLSPSRGSTDVPAHHEETLRWMDWDAACRLYRRCSVCYDCSSFHDVRIPFTWSDTYVETHPKVSASRRTTFVGSAAVRLNSFSTSSGGGVWIGLIQRTSQHRLGAPQFEYTIEVTSASGVSDQEVVAYSGVVFSASTYDLPDNTQELKQHQRAMKVPHRTVRSIAASTLPVWTHITLPPAAEESEESGDAGWSGATRTGGEEVETRPWLLVTLWKRPHAETQSQSVWRSDSTSLDDADFSAEDEMNVLALLADQREVCSVDLLRPTTLTPDQIALEAEGFQVNRRHVQKFVW